MSSSTDDKKMPSTCDICCDIFTKQIRKPIHCKNCDLIACLSCIKIYLLSKDDINLFNPNSKTSPMFSSKFDFSICKKIYDKNPILINENIGYENNSWNLEYWRMFDMSNDSNLFHRKEQLLNTEFILQKDSWFVKNEKKLNS